MHSLTVADIGVHVGVEVEDVREFSLNFCIAKVRYIWKPMTPWVSSDQRPRKSNDSETKARLQYGSLHASSRSADDSSKKKGHTFVLHLVGLSSATLQKQTIPSMDSRVPWATIRLYETGRAYLIVRT